MPRLAASWLAAGLLAWQAGLGPVAAQSPQPPISPDKPAPGSSVRTASSMRSNRIGTVAETLLLAVPEVVSTGRRTGSASATTMTVMSSIPTPTTPATG